MDTKTDKAYRAAIKTNADDVMMRIKMKYGVGFDMISDVAKADAIAAQVMYQTFSAQDPIDPQIMRDVFKMAREMAGV